MDTIGVEISDVGVLAVGGAPPALLPVDGDADESPGIALFADRKQAFYGVEAQRQARLMPRQVNDRFWSQLGTHPVSGQPAGAANYAEMAFTHLRAIRERTGGQAAWSMATPAFLDPDRLGILLGIAQELRIQVVGLCHLAVAAMPPEEPNPVAFHIDLHQHETEIVRLAVGERVALDKTHVLPGQGHDSLVDALCRQVANEFVRATRYDPLHQAATEQQLFLQLLGILRERGADAASTVEIQTGRTAYAMAVLPQMLLDAATGIRRALVNALRMLLEETPNAGRGASLWLSHRAAWVPGLVQELRALPGARLVLLPKGAAAFGALAMAEEAGGTDASGSVPFLVSRLRGASGEIPPSQESVAEETDDTTGISPIGMPPMPGSEPDEAPTHALLGHRAWPLTEEGWWLCVAVGGTRMEIAPDPEAPRLSRRLGTIRIEDGRPVLRPEPDAQLDLDGRPVDGPAPLRAGAVLRAEGVAGKLRLFVVESV